MWLCQKFVLVYFSFFFFSNLCAMCHIHTSHHRHDREKERKKINTKYIGYKMSSDLLWMLATTILYIDGIDQTPITISGKPGPISTVGLPTRWWYAQSDQSSLSARRKLRSLAINWAHSEDSDQTGWMPRLIWVFAGRTCNFVGFVMRRLSYY